MNFINTLEWEMGISTNAKLAPRKMSKWELSQGHVSNVTKTSWQWLPRLSVGAGGPIPVPESAITKDSGSFSIKSLQLKQTITPYINGSISTEGKPAPEEPEQTIELNGKKYKLVEV
jgi:hypothetical protein